MNISKYLNYHPKRFSFNSFYNNTPLKFYKKCSSSTQVKTLVFVHSHPAHHSRRLQIRNSWGSYRLFPITFASIFFVIGAFHDQNTYENIRHEMNLYQDVILGEFPEEPDYFDIKALPWLDWTSKQCPNIQYLIKTQDKAFLDLITLKELMKKRTMERNEIMSLERYDESTLVFNKHARNWIIADFFNRYTWSNKSRFYNPYASSMIIDWSEDFPPERLNWESFKGAHKALLTNESLEPAFGKNFYTSGYKNFFIIPKNTCHIGIKILIIIPTTPKDYQFRQVVRQTLGNPTIRTNLGVGHAFILGRQVDHIEENKIIEESSKNDDMVVGDYIDSFRNGTLKALSSIQWTKIYCPYVEDVVKIEPNVFLNIFELTNFLRSNIYENQKSTNIFCSIITHNFVIRNIQNLYYLSPTEYSPSYFPEYCSGLIIIVSKKIFVKLLDEYTKKPETLWIEDVFITGILAKRIKVGRYSLKEYIEPNANKKINWKGLICRLLDTKNSKKDWFIFWKDIHYIYKKQKLLNFSFYEAMKLLIFSKKT